MKKLVVNADDLGLTEGISRGIIDGFNTGIITSASLIATMPAFQHAVELAKQNPALDVGVHLSLTVGKPCSNNARIRRILKEEEFVKNYGQVIKGFYAGEIRTKDIKQELSAQIRKVEEAGLKITHLNSHQHIHMVPGLFRLSLALMKEHNIPFVRVPNELIRTRNLRTGKVWGLLILGLIGRAFSKKVIDSGLKTTEYFWGLSCTEAMSLQELIRVLGCLKSGINELMCHPGYDDPALHALYEGPYFRQVELNALRSREAMEFVEQEGIQLTSFTKLLKQ